MGSDIKSQAKEHNNPFGWVVLCLMLFVAYRFFFYDPSVVNEDRIEVSS